MQDFLRLVNPVSHYLFHTMGTHNHSQALQSLAVFSEVYTGPSKVGFLSPHSLRFFIRICHTGNLREFSITMGGLLPTEVKKKKAIEFLTQASPSESRQDEVRGQVIVEELTWSQRPCYKRNFRWS